MGAESQEELSQFSSARHSDISQTRHIGRALARNSCLPDAGATNSRDFLPQWKETDDGKEARSETIPEKRSRAGRHGGGRIADQRAARPWRPKLLTFGRRTCTPTASAPGSRPRSARAASAPGPSSRARPTITRISDSELRFRIRSGSSRRRLCITSFPTAMNLRTSIRGNIIC